MRSTNPQHGTTTSQHLCGGKRTELLLFEGKCDFPNIVLTKQSRRAKGHARERSWSLRRSRSFRRRRNSGTYL